MIIIKDDKTGVTEEIPNTRIEVREGKLPNTWVWVIKGIEKLEKFAADAIDPDTEMLLSRESQKAWAEKKQQLQEQAISDKLEAVEDFKG